MAAPIYANPAELAEYMTGDPEATPLPIYAPRLRSASRLVTKAIESAVYAVDGDNWPTDLDKLDAVHEATMEQASAWITNDIDPAAGVGQLKRTVKSKSLTGGAGGASVTYDDDPAAQLRVLLATGVELTPTAWAILEAAGLVSNRVAVTGSGARDTYLVGTPYDITTGQLQP